jgi:Rrf2 family protein
MAHITTGVEYGLHCLLYLADPQGADRPASARDLADLQGIPVEYVAKLFTKLQHAGLLTASEGKGGGFRLARAAEDISVLDVITAIDGDKPLFECREIRGRCALFEGKQVDWAIQGVCGIHAIMLEAESRMRDVLAENTVAGLAATVAAKTEPGFNLQVADWLANRSPGPRRTPKPNRQPTQGE